MVLGERFVDADANAGGVQLFFPKSNFVHFFVTTIGRLAIFSSYSVSYCFCQCVVANILYPSYGKFDDGFAQT